MPCQTQEILIGENSYWTSNIFSTISETFFRFW